MPASLTRAAASSVSNSTIAIDERTIHTVRSSNLPFYAAVWEAAKSCSGLVGFEKRFYWDTPAKGRSGRAGKPRRTCALVDVVARGGEEWVKVSTVTESRLLFEKAKAGWENEGSDDDSEGDERGAEEGDGIKVGSVMINDVAKVQISDQNGRKFDFSHKACHQVEDDSDDDDRPGILKTALDLQKAARDTKVNYKHPRIRFVLPKISATPLPEICSILDSIRDTGAIVETSADLIRSQESSKTARELDSVFQIVHTDLSNPLSTILNIDCTILLALVSDLSHQPITPEPWFHRAIRRQIDMEAKEHLLPESLWPAIVGRDLLCTRLAAKRMREIVQTIGTEAEKARTAILLGNDQETGIGAGTSDELQTPEFDTSDNLCTAFQRYSMHPVPANWRLPIKIVDEEIDLADVPPIAEKVKQHLSEINQSVFLWGWTRGYTTVTSNRTVVKTIREIVEAEDGEVLGPKVWMCAVARSLVGKEKGRRE
ncbi:hypothetical protein MMC25_004840 [Agyrium rufum]|nr:hypothetical protein [Agyrium rufum]